LKKNALNSNPSGDDWSFMGAIGLHAKLTANVISKISGSIQNH